MKHSTLERFAAAAAAATLALVVAGAAANAAIRPDDRASRGPGAVAVTNAWVVAESAARPDDRPTHGVGAVEAAPQAVVVRPDDRGDRRLPGSAPVVQPIAGNTFDWVDAGIGSAATFGLVLLAAGASLVLVRRGAQTA